MACNARDLADGTGHFQRNYFTFGRVDRLVARNHQNFVAPAGPKRDSGFSSQRKSLSLSIQLYWIRMHRTCQRATTAYRFSRSAHSHVDLLGAFGETKRQRGKDFKRTTWRNPRITTECRNDSVSRSPVIKFGWIIVSTICLLELIELPAGHKILSTKRSAPPGIRAYRYGVSVESINF